MNLQTLKIAAGVFAAAVGFALIGCGGGGDSGFNSTGSATNGDAGSGTLAVRMSDGLNPDVTAVNVHISRVEANVNGDWRSIPVETTDLNLFDVNESDVMLATGEIPTGTYNQVRIFVDSATVTDSSGTHDVTIPSGAQTGIKLNVDYRINRNDITTLLLDFNADKSFIHQTGSGKWMLKPVIPVVVKVLSGTITGDVAMGGNPDADVHVSAIYTGGSNYAPGTEVNTTFTNDAGHFKLWALLPGTYRLEFSQNVADTTHTATVNDVTVTADHNTDVGTVTLE